VADLERRIAMRFRVYGIGCAALLLFVGPLFAHPPRGFNQLGFAGAGSMFRPVPNIPGWNTPRLYPSFGGYRGFGPIVAVSVGVPFYPPPIYNPPLYSPPVVVPPPIETIEFPPPANVPAANPPPIRGQAAGRFRPVGPGNRDQARMALPNAPKPNPIRENPMVSHARMVREGRAAFANGEYGRAADWFQRAIAVAPVVADGHLLLAQAWIALGKYVDAAAEIHRGVQLDRTWPTTGSPIRELYGPRQVDFDRHSQQLADAADAFPDDAALQFVLAYVHWFDGQRLRAQRIFESLRNRVANPDVVELFLGTP
jgi:hypothetical protein